jgi:eukaryotic-like serine/threonine-protein kinase
MNHRRWLVILFISLLLVCCKKKDRTPPPPPPPPPPSSEKLITSFTFRAGDNITVLLTGVVGSIGADTITVKLDQGLNISNLTPTIIYTGASIIPNSNTAQNFNNTINYTVKAADGSTKKYTIKIVIVTANQKVYVGSDDGNLYALNAHYGTLLWKYTTGGAIQSSPTLVNNTVYVGSNDKYLYAIDAGTGAFKWKYLTNAPIRGESPVVSNGTVYISCANTYVDGDIYAIDAVTGILKWSKYVPIPTSPLVSGGRVFVQSLGGSYYALNESDGSVIWERTMGLTRSTAAISNGKLYTNLSGVQQEVRCLDASTGNTIWSVPCSSGATGPTVHNGTVYVNSSISVPQYTEAYDATTGSFKWRYSPIHSGNPQPPIISYPVASGNLLYPGFHYGTLHALNATTGALAWEFGNATQSLWFANPTVANGVVYVGGNDKNVYAVDATTGNMKWKFLTSGNVTSGPCTIDSDGNIVHAGSSGATN